ncbi:MAG TPA: hypothetical protein VMY41_03565, partial [Thermohalobaculum sp.]|nr:hypothetical protein [Thermohalobaculum sp.]
MTDASVKTAAGASDQVMRWGAAAALGALSAFGMVELLGLVLEGNAPSVVGAVCALVWAVLAVGYIVYGVFHPVIEGLFIRAFTAGLGLAGIYYFSFVYDDWFFYEVLISGLLAGVMYALVALGFVLIFKASGIFNFAQGVLALFAALTLVGFQTGQVPFAHLINAIFGTEVQFWSDSGIPDVLAILMSL